MIIDTPVGGDDPHAVSTGGKYVVYSTYICTCLDNMYHSWRIFMYKLYIVKRLSFLFLFVCLF